MKRKEAFKPYELNSGAELIAGMDEAGRGCLAGPLAVGLTVFSKEFFLNNLPDELKDIDDSKKLSPARRESFMDSIKKHALFSCVIHISSKKIDSMGINPATEFAIIRGLYRAELSGIQPQKLFLDGNFNFKNISKHFPDLDYESVKGGDSSVFCIAASSILAKVTRDRRMIKYEKYYPGYGLLQHKGYGTLVHRNTIKEAGLSPIHRKSYTLKS